MARDINIEASGCGQFKCARYYHEDRTRSGRGRQKQIGGGVAQGRLQRGGDTSSLTLAAVSNNWGLKGVRIQSPPCYSV